MVAFYVFSLVLGGGFLGLSLFGDIFGTHGDVSLSGTDVSTDVDVGLESDLGIETDMDADVQLETDVGHLGADVGHDLGSSHAGVAGGAQASHVAAKIFSIRTVTYSLFGFGAVGTLLTYWFHAAPGTTLAFAVAGGLVSGSLVNAAFAWVKHSESGTMAGEATFTGHSGRVTLPIAGSGGKILVEHSGREVELRALPHPSAVGEGDPTRWKAVVVVEMNHGVALVAPVSKELLG